jgi:hypothetical protein
MIPHLTSAAWNSNICTYDPVLHNTYMFNFEPVTFDGFISKIDSTGALTNQRRISTISGNPLGFPIADSTDEHSTVALGPDGDGILHACGGFHNQTLRLIKQATAGVMSTWTDEHLDAAFSSSAVWCFQSFHRFSDGTLLLQIFRSDNSNATMNIGIYTRAPGAGWVKKTDAVQGNTSSNGYGAFYGPIYIDGNDVMHLFFVWHGNISNPYDKPGPIMYMRSADKGNTWQNVSGTAITIPLTLAGTAVASTGISPFSGTNYADGVCLDASGYPNCACSTLGGGNAIVRWNGTAWEQIIPVTAALSRNTCLINLQGQLWQLGQRSTTVADPSRVQLIRIDQAAGPRMGPGLVEDNWIPQYDENYFKAFNVIRTFTPAEDNTPRLYTFGDGSKRFTSP